MKDSLAYCGLDCQKCDAWIATMNDDDQLRNEVAAAWSRLNNVLILPEMIYCDGCKEVGRKTIYCESICQVRQCAIDQGYHTCAECFQLEHCQKILPILSSSKAATENFKQLKH